MNNRLQKFLRSKVLLTAVYELRVEIMVIFDSKTKNADIPQSLQQYKSMKDKDKYPNGVKQGRLAPGYYQMHVLLEESSSLCLKKNEDVDAMITVQAFGQIQYSKVLKKVGYESKLWGEHFYFCKSFSSDELQALQRSLIIIKAWDHRKILKDALIGEHELSVSKIYEKQRHLMSHTWIALSNITKNFGQISGMVKVSVNVTGQKDQAEVLELQPYNASKKDKNILLASGIERKGHQLSVDIYEGCDLKPVAGQTTDAYIGVEFGMIYSRTETVVNDCNPKWNEVVQIPVHLSESIATIEHIVLRLIDANVFKSKQVMGSCYIAVNQLIQQKNERSIFGAKTKFTNRYDQKLWVNFYGPQSQCQSNQYKHKYSIYPDIAPYYVGSVLLKVILENNSNPKKDHRPLEVEVVKQQKAEDNDEQKVQINTKPKKFFKAKVKFEMGMNLPIKYESYQMSVRIGSFQAKSKMKRVKSRFTQWNNEVEFFPSFYQNQEFPDVFFYLINENQDRICYHREKIKLEQDLDLMQAVQQARTDKEDIIKKQPKKYYKGELIDNWRKLKPDLTKISIYEEEAGYVKFKLQVQSVVENKNKRKKAEREHSQAELQISENQTQYSVRFMKIPCKIMVDLYCAQNLLAGDDDGSADPYFKFTFQESVKLSSVKQSTVNPVYIERVILQGSMGDKNEVMPLIVTVLNKNPLNDQAIGTCWINLHDEFKNKKIDLNTNYNKIPQWYDITIDGNFYGKFLAGITILNNNKIKPKEQITFFEDQLQTFQINLFVLGVRGLKSSNSIISIRKPIIYFDFDSLFTYSTKQINREKQELKVGKKDIQNQMPSNNAKIQFISTGSSVNIRETIKRTIKLPENKNFWPKLWGRVTNQVIGNLYQPHIGYFYIDLKQSYERTKKLKQQFELERKNTSKQISKAKVQQVKQKLKNINQAVLNNLTIFIVKSVKYNWHEACKQTKKKLNKLKLTEKEKEKEKEKDKDKTIGNTKALDQKFIVIMPSYVWDEQREIYVQQFKEMFEQNKQYIKIGYDNKDTLQTKTKDQRNRHYRYCLDKTFQAYYEEVNKVKLGVYEQVPIKKGRTLLPQQKSILTTFVPQQREVGFYKGNCILFSQDQLSQQVQKQFISNNQGMLQQYMTQQKFKMYLYIINASGLPSKVPGSLPDPYLVVKLGQGQPLIFKEKNSQKSAEPSLNTLVKYDLKFPENSEIVIQLWDRHVIQDQLIGQAVIYAQNRVFYQFGKMKFNNPAQTHPLKVMQSRQQQGKVRFWVDFVPLNSVSLYKEFDISSSASPEYEVRVIVWNCCDIIQDEQDFTGMFDLYISCCFNNEVKDTDVHYRTQNGDGSFNWRMIYPVRLPITDTTLVFKIYDKSLIRTDECKVAGEYDLRKYLQEAYENQKNLKLFEGKEDMYSELRLPCEKKADKTNTIFSYNIFPVKLKNRKSEESSLQVQGGKVFISVQILPKVMAQKRKAGQGRGEPNQHPNLPEPTGRFQFSMNPITMFKRLFGKKFRNKLCMVLMCFLFVTGFTYFFPSLAGSLLAAAI